jgi:hypothetical protein
MKLSHINSDKKFNPFFIFFLFYKEILHREFPDISSKSKEIAIQAGIVWDNFDDDTKNHYYVFAQNQYILMNGNPTHIQFASSANENLKIIFDPHCILAKEQEDDKFFNLYIDMNGPGNNPK